MHAAMGTEYYATCLGEGEMAVIHIEDLDRLLRRYDMLTVQPSPSANKDQPGSTPLPYPTSPSSIHASNSVAASHSFTVKQLSVARSAVSSATSCSNTSRTSMTPVQTATRSGIHGRSSSCLKAE